MIVVPIDKSKVLYRPSVLTRVFIFFFSLGKKMAKNHLPRTVVVHTSSIVCGPGWKGYGVIHFFSGLISRCRA